MPSEHFHHTRTIFLWNSPVDPCKHSTPLSPFPTSSSQHLLTAAQRQSQLLRSPLAGTPLYPALQISCTRSFVKSYAPRCALFSQGTSVKHMWCCSQSLWSCYLRKAACNTFDSPVGFTNCRWLDSLIMLMIWLSLSGPAWIFITRTVCTFGTVSVVEHMLCVQKAAASLLQVGQRKLPVYNPGEQLLVKVYNQRSSSVFGSPLCFYNSCVAISYRLCRIHYLTWGFFVSLINSTQGRAVIILCNYACIYIRQLRTEMYDNIWKPLLDSNVLH